MRLAGRRIDGLETEASRGFPSGSDHNSLGLRFERMACGHQLQFQDNCLAPASVHTIPAIERST